MFSIFLIFMRALFFSNVRIFNIYAGFYDKYCLYHLFGKFFIFINCNKNIAIYFCLWYNVFWVKIFQWGKVMF